MPRLIIGSNYATTATTLVALAVFAAVMPACDDPDDVDVVLIEADEEPRERQTVANFSDLEEGDFAEQEQEGKVDGDHAHRLAAAPPERHCTLHLNAGESELGFPTEPVCFSRFSDAIAFATGETLDAGVSPADYRPLSLTTGGHTAAPLVVGIEYVDKSYKGDTLTLVAPSGCSYFGANKNYTLSAVWNNKFSSSKTWGGCKHSYHYDAPNFSGTVLDTTSGSPDFGAMDNNTSSILLTY